MSSMQATPAESQTPPCLLLEDAFCAKCRSYGKAFLTTMSRYPDAVENLREMFPRTIDAVKSATTRDDTERAVMKLHVLAV